MSDDPRKSAAAEIVAGIKGKIEGQKMDPERLKKAQEQISTAAEGNDRQEAAAFTEAIVHWLNAEWLDHSFSPEQRIFSLTLAYLNFREQFPSELGGLEKFKQVAAEAAAYYAENSK